MVKASIAFCSLCTGVNTRSERAAIGVTEEGWQGLGVGAIAVVSAAVAIDSTGGGGGGDGGGGGSGRCHRVIRFGASLRPAHSPYDTSDSMPCF